MEHNVERQQLQQLESRYHHLDNRVGSLGEDLASVKSTLVNVVETLNRVATDLKPQPVSVTAWLGIAIVVVSMLGATFMGVTGYVNLQLDPLRSQLKHYDELYHINDRRLGIAEQRLAAAEVARRAIGDYAKEHHNDESKHVP